MIAWITANLTRVLVGLGCLILLLVGCVVLASAAAVYGLNRPPEVVVQQATQPALGQPSPLGQPSLDSQPAVVAGCLSLSDFVAIWTASSPTQGPGPLIQALNQVWDQNGLPGGQSRIGTGWLTGPMAVEPMSLVWTDLLSNPAPAPYGKWVPLRTQGNWGVFAVYDRLVVPTPGRSARMCESLDPANQLPGWD